MIMDTHESWKKIKSVATARIVAAPVIAALAFFIISNFLAMRNLFVIVDGGNMVLYRTYETNVQNALAEAGISINNTDYISFPEANALGGFSEIFIERASYVTIEVDGKKNRLITYGESVGYILGRVGVKLNGADQVVPDLGAPTYDGMNIVVTRYGAKLEYENEPIAFEEVKKANPKLEQGSEHVIQEGSNGEYELIYQLSYVNGKLESRDLIAKHVILEPVERIVEYGTAGTITVNGVTYIYSRSLSVTATAYSAEGRPNARTATGTVPRVGAIAVDPKVIPLGSRVYIEGANGKWIYGIATCEDTGGAIKGNIIDLYFDTIAECWAFGRRKATVYILG